MLYHPHAEPALGCAWLVGLLILVALLCYGVTVAPP